jgi:hypothetical protein
MHTFNVELASFFTSTTHHLRYVAYDPAQADAACSRCRRCNILTLCCCACCCCRRQLVTGNPQLGYDVGSITSLALVGVAGPRASVRRSTVQLQYNMFTCSC